MARPKIRGRGRATTKSDDRKATENWGMLAFNCACILLGLARLIGALLRVPTDCDEVFNFDEPLHYMLYGKGFQTWEHSPRYSLRSYLFVLLHAMLVLPARVMSGYEEGRILVYYALKCVISLFSLASEIHLASSLRSCFGIRVGTLFALLSAPCAGMFAATSAFLPSSFAMISANAALSFFLRQCFDTACFIAAFGMLVSWPFAGACAVPMGIMACRERGFLRTFWVVTASCTLVLALSLIVDSHFYGVWTLPVVNLIRYNIAGTEGKGSSLYGTEPITFYIKNLTLNFGPLWILAAASPLAFYRSMVFARGQVSGSGGKYSRKWRDWPTGVSLGTALSVHSLAVPLFAMPHKEERFMYPIYAPLLVGAALTLEASAVELEFRFPRRKRGIRSLMWGFVAGCAALGVARSAALTTSFNAPSALIRSLGTGVSGTLCLRDEWYRFPSHFFVPSMGVSAAFVEGTFKGALPTLYDLSRGGTMWSNPALNDANELRPGMTVADVHQCDFMLLSENEEPWMHGLAEDFSVVSESDMLDQRNSHTIARAYFIPLFSFHNTRALKLKLWQLGSRRVGSY